MKSWSRWSLLCGCLALTPLVAAAATQLPKLEQLYDKAGILDTGMISQRVQTRLKSKYRDATKANPKQGEAIVREIEQELRSLVAPYRDYMACREAVERADASAVTSACSKSTVDGLESKIDDAKLQDLKYKLGLEKLPGSSCTEDESFACYMKCSTVIICPCCQD